MPRPSPSTPKTDDATRTLAPKLRFPKFGTRAEWDAVPGNELFDLVDRRPAPAGLPILAITQEHGPIPRDQIDYHVSVTDASIASYKEVRPNDFIISLRSFQGGIEYSRFHGVCSPAYLILNRKGEGSDHFYRHLFKSERFIQQLVRNIEGLRDGKMISYKQFSEQHLPAPKADEQQKIADCLTSLDDCVAAQGRKVETLKAHKKGLMQHLFPREGETLPRLRFPEFRGEPEWEAAAVGSRSTSFSGGTPDTANKDFYGGNIPFIRSAEIAKSSTELSLTVEGLEDSAAKMVENGDVLVALYGANSGDVAMSRVRGAINQAILCVRPKGSKAFLYHALTERQPWILATYVQGGQGNLSGEIVKSIPLRFPSLEEQKAVAECLSSVDSLVDAAESSLGLLRAHKTGLMQQLFPEPPRDDRWPIQ